jgi:hypothetical protein
MEEVWKDLPILNNRYKINNSGLVLSLVTDTIMKPFKSENRRGERERKYA